MKLPAFVRRHPRVSSSILVAMLALLIFIVAAPSGKVQNTDLKKDLGGDTLVLMLHGYTFKAEALQSAVAALRKAPGFANANVIAPDMPLELFSMARAEDVLADLLVGVDRAWDERVKAGNPYRRIVLVGHSSGALFARKLYTAACGENEEAPFDKAMRQAIRLRSGDSLTQVRPWSGHVERIILLAGMNRGWSISHHMSFTRAVSMQCGVGLGYVLKWAHGRLPIIFAIRKGSPFITELRLQWLAMRAHAPTKKAGGATTVQLLGTIDDLVSPDDNVDLVSGRDFIYREVLLSGHKNVIEMDEQPKAPEDAEAARQRRIAFTAAISENLKDSEEPSPIEADVTIRTNVTDVVFVIHGIRDEGHWTRKIAFRAQQQGRTLGRERIVATITSSYGYFPMLSFLRPGARQEKVAWLMDRYTEARAQYPNARFHYIGHSNGTYLLTKALEDYPAVSFEQVVFAGSVVRRQFDWDKFIKQGRVKKVLNFVATADWVVAFFPKALQIVGAQDLGSAGHDGFDEARPGSSVFEPVKNNQPVYVEGGHSAALAESMWDAIGHFALTGDFVLPKEAHVRSTRRAWVVLPGSIAPLIWIVLLAMVGALGWLIWWLMRARREWQKTIALMVYGNIIWNILTRL